MNKRRIIEDAIINMIREKIVFVGDAVPSIRKMAKRYGVSVTPVIEAYRNLELRGVLESRSRSGFVVASSDMSGLKNFMDKTEPCQDVAVNWADLTNVLHEGLGTVYSYDFNYAFLTPPMASHDIIIQHIITTLRTNPQLLNADPHGYDDPTLVASIAWCMSHYRCIIKKNEICITNNDYTLPLIYALQSCLNPNQAVLLTTPCDKCHIDAVRRTGHEAFYISNSFDGLDLNMLERMLIKRPHIGCLIISPNFQQPNGLSMSVESRFSLGEICSKYNICIIEDDRNRHLAFNGICPLPIKTIVPNDTIYVQSLSFPIMPNLQIHWSCPGKYTNDFRAHRDSALASPPAFMQRSIASYMDSMQHKKDIFTAGKELGEICSLVKDAVAASFPSGTYSSSPEGGCMLWVELPESVNCDVLADEAKANGISISAASDYSFQGNWIIINYSTIVGNRNLLKGVYKLGALACELDKGRSEG